MWLIGSRIDADLDAAEQGAKSQAMVRGRRMGVMSKWLGIKQQFRDPGAASSPKDVSSEASGPVSL